MLTVMKSWHANMERETAVTLATVSLQLKNAVYDSYAHLNQNNYLIIKKKKPHLQDLFFHLVPLGEIYVTTACTPPLNLSSHLNSHKETHLRSPCCGRPQASLLAVFIQQDTLRALCGAL